MNDITAKQPAGRHQAQPFLTLPWHAFGYRFNDLKIDGKPARYAVLNERAVRATAGLTFLAAAIAFAFAYFWQIYGPIRFVTVLACVDFALRLATGMTPLSPFGVIGTWLVRHQKPEWVGAVQKRFAWSIGLVMSGCVACLTNMGMNGVLSSSLCMICLLFMWMETALGICAGCKVYGLLLNWRVIKSPTTRPACPGGVCDLPPPKRPSAVQTAAEAS